MAKYAEPERVLEYARLVDKGDLGYTDEDAFTKHIVNMLDAASREIDRYCKRPNNFFNGGATITEYHDGHPRIDVDNQTPQWKITELRKKRQVFWFNQYPIVSITSIHENKSDIGSADDYDEITSTYYRYDANTGKLTFALASAPNEGTQNLRLIYVAGYSGVPDDVEEVCAQLVGNRLLAEAQHFNTQLTKWRNPDQMDFDQPMILTKDMKRRLDHYRKRRI